MASCVTIEYVSTGGHPRRVILGSFFMLLSQEEHPGALKLL